MTNKMLVSTFENIGKNLEIYDAREHREFNFSAL